MADPKSPTRRYTYPRRMRLSGSGTFLELKRTSIRINVGPLQFQGRPNDLGHPRLGLSVSRRAGTAVVRNRIKRLLRESLRQTQHEWPADSAGYDLVISVRSHEPMPLAEYRAALVKAMRLLHEAWTRKAEKSKRATTPVNPPTQRSE